MDNNFFFKILQKQVITSNLTLFYLRNKAINTITTDFFKIVPDALIIYMARNDLYNIENDAFNSTQNLANLFLNNNLLTNITSKMFNGLQNLKSLILSKNKISFIQNGSFDDLFNLTRLLIDRNNLITIDISTNKKSAKYLTTQKKHFIDHLKQLIKNYEEKNKSLVERLLLDFYTVSNVSDLGFGSFNHLVDNIENLESDNIIPHIIYEDSILDETCSKISETNFPFPSHFL
jgi:Leucine-rich repeat (LRR) protein